MNIFTLLLTVALLGIGFVGGMAFVTIFTAENVKALREENRSLRSTVTLLKRQKRDTIEIIYNDKKDEIDFSQKW